jgi:hypothetical protein
MRDPELYLAVYDMAAADVLVASECLHHFVARSLTDPLTGAAREPLHAPLSLSLLVLKPTPGAITFLASVAAARARAPAERSDVDVFTDVLIGGPNPDAPRARPSLEMTLQPVPGGSWNAAREQDLFPRYPPRVNDGTQAAPYWAFDGALGLGVLPVGLFTNGHTFFVSDLPSRYRLKPYTAHGDAEVLGGGVARARLRGARLWADAPAYYAHTALLALNMMVPAPLADATAALRTPAGGASDTHAALMTWQSARIAEALALAQATGRALVLPRLLCACDERAERNCTCVLGLPSLVCLRARLPLPACI